MERTFRHSLIKRVQTDLPRGRPFDLSALRELGVSPQLAARYASSGWLVRLGHGVYCFAGDNLDKSQTVGFLQTRVAGLHVGGKSALALQSIQHNLGTNGRLVLWGDARFTLPAWFVARFPARYVCARLFDWPADFPAERTLTTPPGAAVGLRVSVPERAILELLHDAGTHEPLEDAHTLFSGIQSMRDQTVGQLLECCKSVKTVRLFLMWARETGVVDVAALLDQHRLPVGSDSRWIARLKDGSLLSLKPHG